MSAVINTELLTQYPDEQRKLEKACTLASSFKDLKLLRLNATSAGGGVAEMNRSLIDSFNFCGLPTHWETITHVFQGRETELSNFFEVTKAMHNGLQGMNINLTAEMRSIYLETNKKLSALIDFDRYDIIIVDDPQPLAVEVFYEAKANNRRDKQLWIWWCHLDLTSPNEQFLEFIFPLIKGKNKGRGYDACIFSKESYVPEALKQMPVFIVTPGLNPFSEKNRMLTKESAHTILEKKMLGQGIALDKNKPVMLQLSRFDPWKDPLGVIDVYRKVKEIIPEVQLLLVGELASDDPEGKRIYEACVNALKNEGDAHVYLNATGAALDTGAFQSMADIVVQKSLREGYGLTVSEALIKAKPVIATNVGGIPLQIEHGVNGYLVNSADEMVDKIVFLLQNPAFAEQLGEKGRQNVRTTSDVVVDFLLALSRLKTPNKATKPIAETH
jgi:trehalose synthase